MRGVCEVLRKVNERVEKVEKVELGKSADDGELAAHYQFR